MAFKFPRNVFGAFGILFLLTAMIVPIQNLVVWGPEWVLDFYTSPHITAEKVSIGVIALGFFMIYLGNKKKDTIVQ